MTDLYTPQSFFDHAALLRQTFVHCAKFLTAASRRSLGRISVPVWLIILSDQLSVSDLVSHYLTNYLMERGPIPRWPKPFSIAPGRARTHAVLAIVSNGCPEPLGKFPRVTHPSATVHFRRSFSFDLHVLSLPPAFVLSQDQTLKFDSRIITIY